MEMALRPVQPKRMCRSLVFSQAAVPTSLILDAPHYSNKILAGLNDLRKDGSLCDYTLVSEDEEFKVHKPVMVACSDYFRVLLMTDMKESKTDQVNLRGTSSVGLRAIVEFAYTGSLNLNLENLEEILAAASHLQVSEAIELCCHFMEKAITIDNCVDVLNMAELYSQVGSCKKSRSYILEHFESLCNNEQFMKLSNSQLCTLLEENSLRVVSEYHLFELVTKWINMDIGKRERFTCELMSHVRLPLLSGEELVEKVSKVDIMQNNVGSVKLLTEAKDYHIVVSKQPLLQTNRTQVRSDKFSLVMCHAENIESYDFISGRHAFLKDAPMPLYNPCVCVVDNFMYACGGKYDSHENNEIATARCFRYDARFDVWFELASMNEARKDFVMIADDNCLYAVAGQDENMVMCTVECFSIAKNDWIVCSSLTHAVYGHAGAMCNEILYISGGQKFDGQCNSMISYDIKQDNWTEEPSLVKPRVNHNMVAFQSKLYVVGGNTEDTYGFPVPVNEIEMYDPATRVWTICEAMLNIREAGSCLLNGKIYIVGGINGQHYYSDLIHSLEPVRDKVEICDRFPSRIFGRACCVLTLPQYI